MTESERVRESQRAIVKICHIVQTLPSTSPPEQTFVSKGWMGGSDPNETFFNPTLKNETLVLTIYGTPLKGWHARH